MDKIEHLKQYLHSIQTGIDIFIFFIVLAQLGYQSPICEYKKFSALLEKIKI